MLYSVNDGELFGLWTAIRLIGEVRDNPDPIVQSDFLTRTQMLLTAFVLGLEPWPGERTIAGPLQPSAERAIRFDA
jgi:hypothetical protein